MSSEFLRIFPERASTFALEVDALYLFLVAVSAVFSVAIAIVLIYFAVRYRRKSELETTPHIHGSILLEIVWTAVPLGLVIVMFVWGVDLYYRMITPPTDALQIYATGKQWMWKFQHPEGAREINELHVPIGQPVQLTMSSQDVIHSLFVPAFRVKQDVLPNRYTKLWFEATKPGSYHLFCAEYCGTAHSAMIGKVVAMEPAEYEAWLSSAPAGESLAQAGERLFGELGCVTCHQDETSNRGPALAGVAGSTVELVDGTSVVADDDYLRQSILNPAARVVKGFLPIMPTFQGTVTEDQVTQLVAYVKSLDGGGSHAAGAKE